MKSTCGFWADFLVPPQTFASRGQEVGAVFLSGLLIDPFASGHQVFCLWRPYYKF